VRRTFPFTRSTGNHGAAAVLLLHRSEGFMSKTLLGAGALALVLPSLLCAQTNGTGDRQAQGVRATAAEKAGRSSTDTPDLRDTIRTHNPSVSTLPDTAGGTDPQRARQR
jgi:hypothetical protein